MAGGAGDNPAEQAAVQTTDLEARGQRPEEAVSMNTLLNYNAGQRTEVLWCNFEMPGLFEVME